MKRQSQNPPLSTVWMLLALVVFCFSATANASAQTAGVESSANKGHSTLTARHWNDPQFEAAYEKFTNSYRLGPGDIIAVRVQGQPEYSKDQLKISPVGAIYLELLGDVAVAGMTIEQTKQLLTKELSEYLKDPKVTVSLLDAVSAKIGVLGEVLKPGIVVMARPMNLLDAITEVGGFANTGSKSNVEVIRQSANGNNESKRVNVNNILRGKSKPEDNIQLQPGDIVFVHGNAIKAISTVTALAGFGSFLSFIQLGRR